MKKKKIFFTILLSLFLGVGGVVHAATSELLAVNFQQKGEVSELELVFDANDVDAEKFHLVEDKQIIVDVKNIQAKERVLRAFDTSEFSGSVVFVSSYKKPGSKDDLRIAIQLRDNVRSKLKRLPKRVLLQIENRFGAFTTSDLNDRKIVNDLASADSELNSLKGVRLHVPKSTSVNDILDNLTFSGRKKYIGKKISINYKVVPVEQILRNLADVSGFNLIMGPEVHNLPALSLSMNDVPWDQALDTILGINKLVAQKNGSILMITTLEKATEDQKLAIEAKRIARKEEPLATKVFPLSYADATEMSKILEQYLTPGKGKITVDGRTNNLIIRDVLGTLEKFRSIIDVLDSQTSQVLIQAKIVEVNESYSKEIGLQQGLKIGYDPIGSLGSTVASTVGGGETAGFDGGPGFTFNSAPSGGSDARSLFGLKIARFSRLVNLDFQLQLMETESKGKIIASPKVIAQDKKKAMLETIDSTSFREVEVSENGSVSGVEFKEISVSIKLEVTPQVTNEGSIFLDIAVTKEHFSTAPSADAPPDIAKRNIQTSVLVDSGSTVVLGGIYNYSKIESQSGVPFLKDIPLIGWLFRTPYNPSTSKTEMIIFMTPRIINPEESGIVDKG